MPLGLLLIDIDRFKSFNDRFGHLLGDKVLKEVARTIRSNTRDVDVVARYGGEEFCVILQEIGGEEIGAYAERVRVAVSTVRLEDPGGGRHGVTVSIGAAVSQGGEPGAHEFIRRADTALYRAKDTGRDRVCVSNQAPGAGRPPSGKKSLAVGTGRFGEKPGDRRRPGCRRIDMALYLELKASAQGGRGKMRRDLCDHYYTCEEVEKMKLTCCTKCDEYVDCHGEAKAAGRRVEDEDVDEGRGTWTRTRMKMRTTSTTTSSTTTSSTTISKTRTRTKRQTSNPCVARHRPWRRCRLPSSARCPAPGPERGKPAHARRGRGAVPSL